MGRAPSTVHELLPQHCYIFSRGNNAPVPKVRAKDTSTLLLYLGTNLMNVRAKYISTLLLYCSTVAVLPSIAYRMDT